MGSGNSRADDGSHEKDACMPRVPSDSLQELLITERRNSLSRSGSFRLCMDGRVSVSGASFEENLKKEMYGPWKAYYVNMAELKEMMGQLEASARNDDLRASTVADTILFVLQETLEATKAHYGEQVSSLRQQLEELRTGQCTTSKSSPPVDSVAVGKGETIPREDSPDPEPPRAMPHRLCTINTQALRLHRLVQLNKEGCAVVARMCDSLLDNSSRMTARVDTMVADCTLDDAEADLNALEDEALDLARVLSNQNLEAREDSWKAKSGFVIFALLAYIVVHVLPWVEDEPRNCLAVYIAAAILWISEAAPSFVIAMGIPIFSVPFGVLKGVSKADEGAAILGKVWDSAQILVLGGMCIGKAAMKLKFNRAVIAGLLKVARNHPNVFLLLTMLATALFSSIASNFAASILMAAALQPVLRQLPQDSGAPQALLLGLAFSANFGGMLTPVASPQNAVAVQIVEIDDISFPAWFLAAVPTAVGGVLLSWAVIIFVWHPFRDIAHIPVLPPVLAAVKTPETLQYERRNVVVVLVVVAVTLALWIIPPEETVGDIGVVALIPVVAFFGTGILRKEDFASLPWHVLFLFAGGNMLSFCVKESGLQTLLMSQLSGWLADHSDEEAVFMMLLIFGVVTNFVSPVVSSIMLMPFVRAATMIDKTLPSSYILLFLCSVMASGSMTFHFTSLSNQHVMLGVQDDVGKSYLAPRHFFLCGAICTLYTFCMAATSGLPWATIALRR